MKLAESTIDHIIPKSMGGTWHHRNLALVCWQCNQAKADTLIDDPEWEQALKRRKAQ